MLIRVQTHERRHRSSTLSHRRCAAQPQIDVLENRIVPATLPTGFSEVAAATGLSGATALEFSPDSKLFVTEQAGTMEVWQGGSRLRADFFQDSPLATYNANTDTGRIDNRGERGLLGVTFDPNFASNRYVYVYSTSAVNADGNTATATTFRNRVSRLTANAAGDLAVPGSEQVILELDNLSSATNHNGGALHFGPDGKLYIAVGDNASGANAQSLSTRHGKMLRINADGSIPGDNPFSSTATGANRAIWALGLRNPFTFSFQPGTGRMHINDVGQNTWEEINVGIAGANYGWPTTEGDFSQATYPSFTRPLYAYSHGGGTFQGYAITGGAFYNPTSPGSERFPTSYDGDYFFADFVNDWINVVDVTTGEATRFASNAPGTVDLRVASDGSLYYLARDAGTVSRVSYTASQAPIITGQPQARTVGLGASATFTVVASGSAPLSYQWQKAEAGTSTWANIAGATGASYTLTAQAGDNGDQFRAIVSNPFGSQTSAAAALTVTANQAPSATIVVNSGLTGGKFIAGQPIAFTASATDPEDGTLSPTRLTWRVEYISSINSGSPAVRPFVPDTGGQSTGNFTPATTGPYTLTDVAYRITLTATDSAGQSTTVTRDVAPNVATITIATDPTGIQVTVDGQPFTSPRTFDSVVGFQRPIGAAASQVVGGTTYNFASWSDGGAATHTISTPLASTTYTARYTATPSGTSGLKAEFFDFTTGLTALPNLAGRTPDVTRIDPSINYTSSDSAWTGLDARFADTFASRHTGSLRVDAAGSYTFYLSSDDGSKLWVDGLLVIDNDGLHGMQERSTTRTLTAGLHTIRVEFFENGGGAGVVLSWSGPGITKQAIPASQFSQPVAMPPAGLKAEFFDSTTGLNSLPNLAGRTPDVTRIDPAINYASSDSAWTGLDARFADTFASRHTGSLRVDVAGSYTLSLSSDDGSKLWVDGLMVIDNDGLHGMQERSATRTLTAGLHTIRVEFFENGGGAGVILSWSGPGITKQAIPASQFSQPAAEAVSSGRFALARAPVGEARPAILDLLGKAPEILTAIKLRPSHPGGIVTPRSAALRPSRFALGVLIPNGWKDINLL